MQTLDRKQRKRLVFNWQSVSELFEADHRLISELHAKGCITSRQQEILEKQQSSHQIRKLMEILSTKSLAHVDVFISCLPETAQLCVRSLMNDTTGNFNIWCLLSIILSAVSHIFSVITRWKVIKVNTIEHQILCIQTSRSLHQWQIPINCL